MQPLQHLPKCERSNIELPRFGDEKRLAPEASTDVPQDKTIFTKATAISRFEEVDDVFLPEGPAQKRVTSI